jgi:hypothetical protein
MAKIKRFELIRVPIQIEYCRPIIGRLYAIYAWFSCVKFFRMKFCFTFNKQQIDSKTVYRLAIPQFTEKVIS